MSKFELEKVMQLISRVSRKPVSSINPQMSFRGDLGMDSLQSLDLLVLIEEELHFVIPQADAVKLQTVQQLLDFMSK